MTTLLLGLALSLGAPATKDDPKKPAPSLVGEWAPSQTLVGGKPEVPPPGATLTFTADGKMVLKGARREKAEESGYKIDAKKNPAEIDITPPATDKGPRTVGIYRFEKDSLIICLAMGSERPKKFESPEGSRLVLITLQRVKKD